MRMRKQNRVARRRKTDRGTRTMYPWPNWRWGHYRNMRYKDLGRDQEVTWQSSTGTTGGETPRG